MAGNAWVVTSGAPSSSNSRLAAPLPALYRSARLVVPAVATENEKVTYWPSDPQQQMYGAFWAPGQVLSVGRLVAEVPAAMTWVVGPLAAVTVAVAALVAAGPGPPALAAITVASRVSPTSEAVAT